MSLLWEPGCTVCESFRLSDAFSVHSASVMILSVISSYFRCCLSEVRALQLLDSCIISVNLDLIHDQVANHFHKTDSDFGTFPYFWGLEQEITKCSR